MTKAEIRERATTRKPESTTPPAKRTWRDVLPVHPAAELFPRMTPDELKALGEDIRKNGINNPVVLWSPGYLGDGIKDGDRPRYVLDGINRLDAMEQVGIRLDPNDSRQFCTLYEKKLVLYMRLGPRGRSGQSIEPGTDPYSYAVSANIHRRHLTAEQKRELIAKLIKAQPDKSDRQIAETAKASPTTVGSVRAKLETAGDVSKLDTRTDTKGRAQPAKKKRTKAETNIASDKPTTIADAAGPPPARTSVDSRAGRLLGGPWNDASEAVRECFMKNVGLQYIPTARDDIGPDSSGEVARLRARVEELEHANRLLESQNVGLRSEVEELKEKLAALTRPPTDDGLAPPECLRRVPKTEGAP